MMQEAVYDDDYKIYTYRPAIEFGDTVLNILKFSGYLIVMGTTGKTNIDKVLFGSISSEIIVNSKIPVLTVPAAQPYFNFSRLVFATDYPDKELEILGELLEMTRTKKTFTQLSLFSTRITCSRPFIKNNFLVLPGKETLLKMSAG